MMPPYTSLWLQILLEIKGTAAWLRTGEASPASEQGGHAVRGALLRIQKPHLPLEGVGSAPSTSQPQGSLPSDGPCRPCDFKSRPPLPLGDQLGRRWGHGPP